MPMELTAALIALIASLVTAFITAYATSRQQEKRLRTELRTEFMAEQSIRQFLEDKRWRMRSFAQIEMRLGGFNGDDLRRLLVRAGALRFRGGWTRAVGTS